jgi:hypothetical protein
MRGDSKRRTWRRHFAPTLAAAVIATAACGTTVPAGQASRAQVGADGVSGGATASAVPGGNAGTNAGPGSFSGAATAGGAAGAGPSGSSSTSVGGAAIRSGGASNGAPSAHGPIKIGALTANGAGKYQSSLGFKGASGGDQVAMTRSVVNYINAHGGLGGRTIQLVSYDLNTASFAADANTAMQAACSYFTQDNKVVAVASIVALIPVSFYECLAKAHVPVVPADEGASSDFFRRYADTAYMPSGPSYTRLLADSVDALWNAGWLDAKSRVGVVGYDTTDVHDIVDKGLVPALQRHGLKLTAGMYTSTTTDAASEYGDGVLSFRSKSVDRVFFAPGGQPIYFALAAEQQAYHPHYELGSLEYPTVLAGNLPADQLSGSMGLAWLPYLDLPPAAWPTVTTPGIAECRKAVASANQDLSSGTNLGAATWICDDWMFLRDAFNVGAAPDEASIRRAAESLANSVTPASTFRSAFSPGRTHDGAAAYRLIAFQDSCKCYKYISAVRPMS